MKQNKRIPRVSTRGYYDLKTGRPLTTKQYDLYPKGFFDKLGSFPEFTIMAHGLRNNRKGALAKFKIAQQRLKQIGYRYPVVGFSYDSNTKGVQFKSHAIKATNVGRIIAKRNGQNLASFILNFKKNNPQTKIRLMGHSLGTEVIIHTLAKLKHKDIIESAYFFGSSVPASFLKSQMFGKAIQYAIRHRLTNYYSPHDQVLKYASESKIIENPIGYLGVKRIALPKYRQKLVNPKNHRFASYSSVMKSFP